MKTTALLGYILMAAQDELNPSCLYITTMKSVETHLTDFFVFETVT